MSRFVWGKVVSRTEDTAIVQVGSLFFSRWLWPGNAVEVGDDFLIDTAAHSEEALKESIHA